MLIRRGYRFGDMWDEMSRLNREMNRVFSGTAHGTRAGVYPPLNVYDDGESFVVRAEIPGIDPNDIEVHATANALTLKGERKREESDDKSSFHRREREHGGFSRSLNLAQPINPDKIQANYKLGVLEVILPKTDEAKPRKIGISA
ncbi:MAG: Hsp20/alpha crystallin family protein [Proteobacteria bacterium]|nr:Hsp20/alpha crystallin family protein [Pseudomonadota bacterium]